MYVNKRSVLRPTSCMEKGWTAKSKFITFIFMYFIHLLMIAAYAGRNNVDSTFAIWRKWVELNWKITLHSIRIRFQYRWNAQVVKINVCRTNLVNCEWHLSGIMMMILLLHILFIGSKLCTRIMVTAMRHMHCLSSTDSIQNRVELFDKFIQLISRHCSYRVYSEVSTYNSLAERQYQDFSTKIRLDVWWYETPHVVSTIWNVSLNASMLQCFDSATSIAVNFTSARVGQCFNVCVSVFISDARAFGSI